MRKLSVVLIVIVVLCGCVSAQEGASVEAEVMAAMRDHVEATTAEDKDKGGDGEYDFSATKVIIDGDMATVTPVTFASSKGSISHTQAKEGSGRCLACGFHRNDQLGSNSDGCEGQETFSCGFFVCTYCPQP